MYLQASIPAIAASANRSHRRGPRAASALSRAPLGAAAMLAVLGLALTGCTGQGDENHGNAAAISPANGAPSDAPEDSAKGATDSPADGTQAEGPASLKEASSANPRATYTHDGGLTTIDTVTGKTLAEIDRPGFLRLNQAGDERTLMVTDGDEVLAYDTAINVVDHGDHKHFYTGNAQLTGASLKAPKAGHVVHHAEQVAVFSDGEGSATIFRSADFTAEGATQAPESRRAESGEGHHGVAVPLEDGSVVMTAGTAKHRDTVRHLDKEGKVLAETHECPGVHGEATAGSAVVFGCEDGPVIFDGTDFHKIAAQSAYQRTATLAGADTKNDRYILGDMKTDKDNEHEHPEQVAVIDAESNSLRPVQLGASYWFRSLGRDSSGNGIVLTTDGHLKVIDMANAAVIADYPVIDSWTENEDWQSPGPALQVDRDTAFVSSPASQELAVVDLKTGEVVARHKLEHVPNELAVTTGRA